MRCLRDLNQWRRRFRYYAQNELLQGDETMKKYLALVGLFVIPMLFLTKNVCADGNYTSVLVTSTNTNQGYLYPAVGLSNVPPVGGLLVQNGALFNWSNTSVTSTNSATSQQFPAFPLLTSAQLNALTPATTGQLIVCTNCATFNAGSIGICASSGSVLTGQWIQVSSATAVSACK